MISDYEFMMIIRQALLLIVDAIERKFDIRPRTCELRKDAKQ